MNECYDAQVERADATSIIKAVDLCALVLKLFPNDGYALWVLEGLNSKCEAQVRGAAMAASDLGVHLSNRIRKTEVSYRTAGDTTENEVKVYTFYDRGSQTSTVVNNVRGKGQMHLFLYDPMKREFFELIIPAHLVKEYWSANAICITLSRKKERSLGRWNGFIENVHTNL